MARRLVFNMHDERPAWAPPPSVVTRLRSALPDDWELTDVEAPVSGRGDGGGLNDEALDAVRGAEIYLGLGLPRDLLRAALEPPSNLRWIHSGAAGVASLLHPELVDSEITLTNSAGIHAVPMAETVIGMVLHFLRGLDHAVRAQSNAEWSADVFERRDSGIRELGGATLGIIGYGGIGREVARRASALDMRVLAVRRSRRDAEHARILSGEGALDKLLKESDVVVVSVPSTPQTRGMIGERELGLMKRDGVLINVARGDVLDEKALLDVLKQGRLRGVGLDVFGTEPLPADSPFWSLPNVLITPHVSATSPRFWERQLDLILENLRRYLRDEPLRNTVDTTEGY